MAMKQTNTRAWVKEDRAIRTKLSRHAKLMQTFMAEGMTKDAASRLAFRIITQPEEKKQ